MSGWKRCLDFGISSTVVNKPKDMVSKHVQHYTQDGHLNRSTQQLIAQPSPAPGVLAKVINVSRASSLRYIHISICKESQCSPYHLTRCCGETAYSIYGPTTPSSTCYANVYMPSPSSHLLPQDLTLRPVIQPRHVRDCINSPWPRSLHCPRKARLPLTPAF